jgi:hypothetical protein
MDALSKALQRSSAVVNTAQASSMRMKDAGFASQITSSPSSGIGMLQEVGRDRQRYGLFRGWLYSAINALASEAAGQPVHVGKSGGVAPRSEEERRAISNVKNFHMSKMTDTFRSKAVSVESSTGGSSSTLL